MATATHNLSDEQLVRFADEHLVYEVRMLVYSAHRLKELRGRKGYEMNVHLEAFVIHVRCLIGFIWGRRSSDHPQDAFAADYCGPDAWPYESNAVPEDLKRFRRRAGREVVHLSYDRLGIGERDKRWLPGSIVGGLIDPLLDLADKALAERMNPATREAIRNPEIHSDRAGAASVASGGYFGGTVNVGNPTHRA